MSIGFLIYGKEIVCLVSAVTSHLTVAVYSFPALSLFSSLSLGCKLFRQGLCCSSSTMEIQCLLQVLKVTLTQIIDTESSEEQHFQCKAGCRFLLGTFLWLLLHLALLFWRVTPPKPDFFILLSHVAAGGRAHGCMLPTSLQQCWRCQPPETLPLGTQLLHPAAAGRLALN